MSRHNVDISVCVVTYNHEHYVRQCLQSLVSQEVDLSFEVIVADDCSTDKTRAVIQEYADRYPKIVRPVFNTANIGPFRNYKRVHQLARGRYVAHVDGDDYALPGKLSRQSQFLDKHDNCYLVAHRMVVLDEHSRIHSMKSSGQFIDMEDLLRRHPVFLNSSIMYRRNRIGAVFSLEEDFIDFYVYVRAASLGPIGFLSDALGVYRSNIGLSSNRQLMPYIQRAIDCAAGRVSDEIINRARSKQYLSYAMAALLDKNPASFRHYVSLARKWNKSAPMVAALFHLRQLHWPLRLAFTLYKRVSLKARRIRALGERRHAAEG